MAQRDLHMQRRSHHMGHQNKHDPQARGRDGPVDSEIPEPCPEKGLTRKLEVVVPPGGAVAGWFGGEQVGPGKDIQIETADE